MGADGQNVVVECALAAAVGCGQRLADKDALTGHVNAFPVRLNQGLAAGVVGYQDAGVREFCGIVARFNHRPITAGGARLQPAQAAHLGTVGELAAGGG